MSLIDEMRRLQARSPGQCTCSPVNGLHDDDCALYDGSDMALAAQAIGVFALIIKETGVPKAKVLKAMEWALDNL